MIQTPLEGYGLWKDRNKSSSLRWAVGRQHLRLTTNVEIRSV